MLLKSENCNCYRMISIRTVGIAIFRASALPNWAPKLHFEFFCFGKYLSFSFFCLFLTPTKNLLMQKLKAMLLKCENCKSYRMISIQNVVVCIFEHRHCRNEHEKCIFSLFVFVKIYSRFSLFLAHLIFLFPEFGT